MLPLEKLILKLWLFRNLTPLLGSSALTLSGIDVCVRVHVHTHAQPCLTLCDPIGCSLSGSYVCGIFQGRILEWGAITFSRGSFPPRDGTRVSCDFCFGRRILCHCTTCEAHFYTISVHRDGIKVERDHRKSKVMSSRFAINASVFKMGTCWTNHDCLAFVTRLKCLLS